MVRLSSIEQLKELIAGVRNLRKGYLTNFYLDAFKHQVWMESGDFKYEAVNETLFLSRESGDFCNLFYCSTTLEELGASLKVFGEKHPELMKMVDVVGSDAMCKPVLDMLKADGYTQYRQLVRMSRITPETTAEVCNEHVSYATVEDAAEIRNILNAHFDAKCEQIPYQEELNEYAKNNRILVYKEEGQILGFVIFESNRSTHYLRYWFVHPGHRDKKIGSILLNTFFYEGRNTRRQLFWVITDNDNAIKRYRHYGFTEEDLYDYVMSK